MTAADFSGYATRNDLRCSDGRTILADAFAENDGQIVPLVWAHGHDDAENVLGHVKLENRPDGVYCHAFFNASAKGQHAKEMVRHGDVKFLSIFANQLVEKVRDRAANIRDVLKGNIREVSLVLAGANPGAEIDNVNIVHGDGDLTRIAEEAYITTGLEIELPNADELQHEDSPVDSNTTSLEEGGELSHESAMELLDALPEKQKAAVYYLLSQALTLGDNVQHSDTDGEQVAGDAAAADGEGAPGDEPVVTDSAAEENGDSDDGAGEEAASGDGESTDDQSAAAPADGEGEEPASEESAGSESGEDEGEGSASGDAAEDTDEAGDAVQHADTNQEDNSMTHNVFDQAKGNGVATRQQASLSHDAVKEIVADAVNNTGSLKRSLENYVAQNGITVDGTLQHGIENIDYLFPDAKTLESSPAFISRRMEWVDKVLSSVRKSPFSRIKTITADITPDEARARGYIKGNMKNEEYFALAKRETTPQTIYKKQKLDRDDVIDIVDLDVVAWLKAEMKVMLDEELAGAILVGDGRSIGDDDKIKESNIRPIASDAELYVTTVNVNLLDASSSVEELVDAVINNRQYYKGTGQPTFYTTEGTISKFLTVKDNFGRRIYSNLAEVAAVLRVSEIVPVEVMERVPDVIGIMVNLADYTLGADRGGQATMFDDFDIDYNKLRYLIETRVSGALTQPKAALVFRSQAGTAVRLADPTEPAFDGTTVTVPTVTHVTYKDGAGTTLTTGSPVALDPGEELHVKATADAGYYFDTNVNDEWDFTGEA
jgi:HK97 family phage prohead protease